MEREDAADRVREMVDAVYRADSRRVLATLIRLLGDFDLAEEAMHDAFAAAVEQWPREGVPSNPRAWLVSTGRFKAIDAHAPPRALRRVADGARRSGSRRRRRGSQAVDDEESVEDDRLRLIFTCCHPALAPDVQVALTLREVCGLTTEEIASAFLTAPTTVAQRIVRAKAKIRDARIPVSGAVAGRAAGPARHRAARHLSRVQRGLLRVVRPSLTRHDLSGEAIRLGRLLVELLPEPEARRLARADAAARIAARRPDIADGELILLDDQDRSLWDRDQIAEGARWSSAPSRRGASVRTRCKRRLRPCMPKRRRRRRPTGRRSSACTTCCCAPIRRRSSS